MYRYLVWAVAHPTLFAIGLLLAKLLFAGRLKRTLDVPLQIVSFVLAIGFLVMAACEKSYCDPVIWIFLTMGPLCCFCTGLSYGLAGRKERLWPFIVVVPALAWSLFYVSTAGA